MKIKNIYFIVVTFLVIGIVIKFTYLNLNSNKPENKKEEEINNKTIVVPEEIQKDTNIISEQVAKKDFKEIFSFNGEVEADPDNIINISSRVSGKVTRVYFKPGSYIKKGRVLLELESFEISKLRSKYLSSLNKFNSTKKNYKRLKELSKLRLAGEQEVINAETDFNTSEAELKTDKANLISLSIPLPDKDNFHSEEASKIQIISQLSGIVISRNVVPGSQIDPNQILGTIGNLSKLWFIFKIFENDLSKVSEGSKALIRLNSYPDENFEGFVTFIGKKVDSVNRTISGRIEFNNKSGLAKIGLFGKAEIEAVIYDTIVISENSIFKIDNKEFVFQEIKPGEYEPKPIKTGARDKESVQVLSGILDGDFIVTKGVYNLKSRLLKSTFGEDE